MFSPCHQTAVSFAQSHLGFPADVLDRLGLDLLQKSSGELQVQVVETCQ
jgi:hypothetical protein